MNWIKLNTEKAIAIAAAVFFLATTITAFALWYGAKGDLKRVTGERNAAQVSLGRCEATNDQWEAAHKNWKAAVDDLELVRQRKDAELKEARQKAARRIQSLETAAANLKAYQPKGEAMCERMSDVDREFVSQLRGVK